ncbi:hypothetical protein HHX47_DHR3001156 [Lentinula edodes]|nr:hypothetical protein HHX47_DHR3001156 [Lentinula edodes]
MSALIKTILPTGKLSAKLEGIDIPAGLRLPELEMVLKDAAEGISKPELDEPLEALRHLRAAIDADQEQVGGTGDMWKENPGLFFVQSVALARSRTDDDKAKETLSRIINDKNIDKGSQGMILLVKSKIYLSQVLRRLGEEQDAQSHEQWLIKWLKKNPHRLPDSTLVEIFTTDTNIKEDPILTESVGTVKHANLKSSCLNVRCRHIFYWISNIEAAMALNKGVGKKYIKEMFEEFDHSFGKDILPMLDLMFGAGGIQTYLGIHE